MSSLTTAAAVKRNKHFVKFWSLTVRVYKVCCWTALFVTWVTGRDCTRDSWTDGQTQPTPPLHAMCCTVLSVSSQIHITSQSVSLQVRYYTPQPGCSRRTSLLAVCTRRILLTLNSLITPPPTPHPTCPGSHTEEPRYCFALHSSYCNFLHFFYFLITFMC